jgi:hypothetical protein
VEGLAGGRFPDWRPSPKIEARGLLYVDEPMLHLSEAQVIAIADSASELGDEGCYLSYVDRYVDPDSPIQDFAVERLSFIGYRELLDRATLNHVLVSQHGRWGVFVTDEGVAVVAGPETFVASVYRTLPPMREQATRYASDILSTELPGLHSWLRDLVNGILGAGGCRRSYVLGRIYLGLGPKTLIWPVFRNDPRTGSAIDVGRVRLAGDAP